MIELIAEAGLNHGGRLIAALAMADVADQKLAAGEARPVPA